MTHQSGHKVRQSFHSLRHINTGIDASWAGAMSVRGATPAPLGAARMWPVGVTSGWSPVDGEFGPATAIVSHVDGDRLKPITKFAATEEIFAKM